MWYVATYIVNTHKRDNRAQKEIVGFQERSYYYNILNQLSYMHYYYYAGQKEKEENRKGVY